MILHKYVDEKGIDIIENLRVKASDPNTFNDPFEFVLGVVPGDADEIRRTFRKVYSAGEDLDKLYRLAKDRGIPESATKQQFREFFKKSLPSNQIDETLDRMHKTLEDLAIEFRKKSSKDLRVMCFSMPKKVSCEGEILMWAHYANNHKGMRFHLNTNEFRIISKDFFPVEYSSKREGINMRDFLLKGDNGVREVYGKYLKTKSNAWSYEEEHRWIISLDECRRDNNREAYVLIPSIAIKQIDLGANINLEVEKQILDLINDSKFDHVEVVKTKIDGSRYKLNYETLRQRKARYSSDAIKPYR